jgi:hypothetical protein
MKYFQTLFVVLLLGLMSSTVVLAQSAISYPKISNGYLKGGSGSFTVTTFSFLGSNFQTPGMTVGDTVVLQLPENDTSLLATDEITIVWKNPTTSYEYILELASDSLFTDIIVDFDIDIDETQITIYLNTISNLPLTVYYRLGTKGPNGVNYTRFKRFKAIPNSNNPIIDLDSEQLLCEGDTLELIPGVISNNGPVTYEWLNYLLQPISPVVLLSNPSDSFALFLPTQTDSFALVVTDASSNKDTAFFKIIVEPIPIVDVNISADSLTSTVTSTSYLWYINDTLSTTEILRSIIPTKVAYYYVGVKTQAGCLALSDEYYYVPRPKNLLPVNNANVPQTTVQLVWEVIEGAEFYRYTISSDPNFTNIVEEGLTPNNSYNFEIPNGVQTPFYWNVRTLTSIDSSFDSETNMFSYSQEPTVALKVSDFDFESVVVGQTATDSIALVNTGNVDVTVTSYRFTSSGNQNSLTGFGISWNNSFSIPVGQTRKLAVSFVPASVGSFTDNLVFITNNQSVSSDTISVLQGSGVGSQTEVPPALVSPLNNSTNVADPVTLRWNVVPTAVTYEVSLDTLQNLSTAQTVVVADTFNVFNGLIKGKQYYWGVKSQFALTESPISPIWSFTTQAPAQTNVVSVNSLTLDDFPVDANASKLFTVLVNNTTTVPQVLTNVTSTNNTEFTVIPQQFAVPIPIPPGGVYSLKVKFKPSASIQYSTVLTPVLSSVGAVASGTINGSGRALAGNESVSNIVLATSSDTIVQGDTLSVFMKIRDRSNFDANTVPKFQIWLEYDKRMLYFLNQNGGIYFNGNQLSNNSFTTVDVGATYRQMSSPPIPFSNSADSTLLLLRFVAMMDTIETSSLYFSAVGQDSSGFLWLNQANNPITTQFTNLENTTINLQLCAVDGKRFIVAKQKQIALMQVSPNPSNDVFVDVEYTVNEDTDATFYLINSAGAIVSDKVKRKTVVSDKQTIRFKTNDLTTGSYFVVVETKTSMDIIGFQTSK